MNENVEIGLSSQLDTKGLDQLRKSLNDQRNELNAVARETDKADIKYKQLKATVSELNRLIKLSDTELKQYASSLIQVEKQTERVNKSSKSFVDNTGRLGAKIGNVKNDLSRYSSTMLDLATNTDKTTDSIVSQIGSLGLFAGGWISLASALSLAAYHYRDWIDAHFGYDLNQEDASMKKTMQDLKDEVNRTTDPNRLQYPNEEPIGDIRIPVTDPRDIIPKKVKTSGNSLKTVKEVKEELNEIQRLQKDLVKLELDKTSYISLYGEQAGIVLETLKKIKETQEKINFLTSGKVIYDTSGIKLEERKMSLFSAEDIRQAQYQAESDYIGELGKDTDSRNTLEDIQTGYSLIGQSMSLLNIGTDTFVGKLMAVFGFVNSALSIGSSIVSFITSILPGVPDSMMSGGNTSVDTNRLINQNISMSSSPVNIYMSSNVSQKYFKAQIENYNSMKQYTKL